MGMVIQPGEYAELLRLRKRRDEDEYIRQALGLAPFALIYGPYGTEPHWIYIGMYGNLYKQVGHCRYQRVDSEGRPLMQTGD